MNSPPAPAATGTGTPSLADYVGRRRIHPRAHATTRDDLLASLALGLHAAGAVSDARAFASAVRRRMSRGATGFHGIALLAARSRAVSAPAAAFARVPARLGWRGTDGRPVSDVFVLAVPKKLQDPRAAQVFSLLARHSAHPGFHRLLRAAHTTDDLYELFRLVR